MIAKITRYETHCFISGNLFYFINLFPVFTRVRATAVPCQIRQGYTDRKPPVMYRSEGFEMSVVGIHPHQRKLMVVGMPLLLFTEIVQKLHRMFHGFVLGGGIIQIGIDTGLLRSLDKDIDIVLRHQEPIGYIASNICLHGHKRTGKIGQAHGKIGKIGNALDAMEGLLGEFPVVGYRGIDLGPMLDK